MMLQTHPTSFAFLLFRVFAIPFPFRASIAAWLEPENPPVPENLAKSRRGESTKP
jgi:hypothetical protein